MSLVEIRPWLVVGNKDDCNQRRQEEYDRIIHIWRSDIPSHFLCQYVLSMQNEQDYQGAIPQHYTLEYREGETLPAETLNDLLQAFQCQHPYYPYNGRILVHCLAGITRSPTIALFLLSMLENKHPLDLLGEINYAFWNQRQHVPNIYEKPLADIIKFYEKTP